MNPCRRDSEKNEKRRDSESDRLKHKRSRSKKTEEKSKKHHREASDHQLVHFRLLDCSDGQDRRWGLGFANPRCGEWDATLFRHPRNKPLTICQFPEETSNFSVLDAHPSIRAYPVYNPLIKVRALDS